MLEIATLKAMIESLREEDHVDKDERIASLTEENAALRDRMDAMTKNLNADQESAELLALTKNLSMTHDHARGDDQPPIEYVMARLLPLTHASSHRHFHRKIITASSFHWHYQTLIIYTFTSFPPPILLI